jgi:citrate synthase
MIRLAKLAGGEGSQQGTSMDMASTSIATAEDLLGWPAYVNRQEAIKVLGVKPQTLYSYVSRGLVRRNVDNGGRSSSYNFQDIQRLKARSLARSGHGPAAANAIHWGEPVLSTAITKITERGPLYGEHLATDLARRKHRFESVAEYLWTGTALADDVIWCDAKHESLGRQLDEITRFHPRVHIRQLLTEVALLLGMEQDDAVGIQGSRSDVEQARDLMQAMAGAFGFLGPGKRYAAPRHGDTIARVLARALGVQATPDVTQALDGILVVVADHEFTPATFAARIAASAGNDLYSCVGAALQVHFGSALGLRCDLLEQRLGVPQPTEMNRATAAASPSRALDHPLYRNGDPRAEVLVEIADKLASRSRSRGYASVMPLEQRTLSIDHALVAACQSLGAARYAAGGLLAFGRMAGWIAHVFEQRREQFVIRPRAKFVPRVL